MSILRLSAFTAGALLLAATAALAGAPLKGIDVKLGKNPGGGAAARTTNASGQADFGVLPAGDYTIEVSGQSEGALHITVSGAREGVVHRDLAARMASPGPLTITGGGREHVVVTVTGD